MASTDLCLRSNADKWEPPNSTNLRLRPTCWFIIIYPGSQRIIAGFQVRQPDSRLIIAGLQIREPWPYWTNRRYLNGIVTLKETVVDDSLLEDIIVGVMNDIKTWLISNIRGEYSQWVNILRTPLAIIRAASYGVIASLYARQIYVPLKRWIVTIPPVSAQIISPEENAMEYWEGKMEEALENYLTAVGSSRLWVSTADEEPVFSMEDIPFWKEIQ